MYRHELKYMINPASAQIIKSRLKSVCGPDTNANKNGAYRVSSLYFDDFCDSAINDNLQGSIKRKKFRIRVYDGKESIIKLERKVKNNKGGLKHSVLITKLQYESIMDSEYGFMKNSENDVITDFYTFLTTRLLQPKVIVDYNREAYVYRLGDVRITFDSNIRSSVSNVDLLDQNNIFARVMRQQDTIMEVKYTGFLPSHIKKIIQTGNGSQQAFSKYVACRSFIS